MLTRFLAALVALFLAAAPARAAIITFDLSFHEFGSGVQVGAAQVSFDNAQTTTYMVALDMYHATPFLAHPAYYTILSGIAPSPPAFITPQTHQYGTFGHAPSTFYPILQLWWGSATYSVAPCAQAPMCWSSVYGVYEVRETRPLVNPLPAPALLFLTGLAALAMRRKRA